MKEINSKNSNFLGSFITVMPYTENQMFIYYGICGKLWKCTENFRKMNSEIIEN